MLLGAISFKAIGILDKGMPTLSSPAIQMEPGPEELRR